MKKREVKFDLESFKDEYKLKTDTEAYFELNKDIFSHEVTLPRFLKNDEEEE